ncbi:hypothetical protein NC796_20130 [Aliifodinibius sp. S!AR15-10]|uniref:hypothetical protein n=1 Tax=Aliifodinibius sp. S!AR15-10 TaxID=2950437 RepID=UPI002856BBCA|nr:hypothetical protein [Aliifodinibius sp. S!AR15-10]MDR8393474.1 hypothetical protein [Aliifodinibius sp. S!AR15-10]
MGFEEMVVAIIGTIAGVGLFGFIIARVTSLIQSWINRKKGGYDEETFNRLAKAFMQHKKETERRLQNLEAIISEEDSIDNTKQISEPKDTIEIEEDEAAPEKQKGSDDTSKLRNMLKN